MKNKLSVITVSYNCVDLIEPTILSVLSQDSNLIEYILIDGGSTDGTLDVIEKYKDRITYSISESDLGIYDAMNKGIDVATSKWLLFLNAGDVFHEDFSLQHLNWNWPDITEFVVFPFMVDGEMVLINPDLNVLFGMPTSHQAMLICSSVAKKEKFNKRYQVAADYDYFIKRYLLNKECIFVEHETLSKVMPCGFSQKNLKLMVSEYQNIIYVNLGLYKAIVFFLWSRPDVFKIIKSILPVSLFQKLKYKFR